MLGFGGAFVSLAISKWMAKRMMGVQVITDARTEPETWLVETVRRLSAQAGIAMPEVGVFQSAAPNAFATGARRDKSLVAVSSGLLQQMSRREVEAVLGHEVSHVANGDMVTLTLIQGIVNTFVFVASRVIGNIVDKVVFRNERGHGPRLDHELLRIVDRLLATMIVLGSARDSSQETEAEAQAPPAAELFGVRDARPGQASPADKMAACGISGRKGEGFRSFS